MDNKKYEEAIKKLNLISIKEAAKDIVCYIDDRRKGLITPLKTRWNKFNKAIGGIEWHMFMTFAGMSGSGKSAIVNELETSLFDLNKDEKFVVLSLNYEMLSSRQVGRKLSFRMNKSVGELYSKNSRLTDADFENVKNYADEVSSYQIYYSEIPDTVEKIKELILNFCKLFEGYGVIVLLDHSRLVKKLANSNESETLNDLALMFMNVKKAAKISIILISQLNRNIESTDRIYDPKGHYPMRSDLFQSDAVYQCSDFVFVLSRPELLNEFMLSLNPVKRGTSLTDNPVLKLLEIIINAERLVMMLIN